MRNSADTPRSDHPVRRGPANRAAQFGWLSLGLFCLGAGLVGSVVPLMPTTIFLILGAGCFARSSPSLEVWLLRHPRLSPPIRAWRAERAIPRAAKRAACIGMGLGYALFCLAVRPDWAVALGVALAMSVCAFWIVRRPLPARGG